MSEKKFYNIGPSFSTAAHHFSLAGQIRRGFKLKNPGAINFCVGDRQKLFITFLKFNLLFHFRNAVFQKTVLHYVDKCLVVVIQQFAAAVDATLLSWLQCYKLFTSVIYKWSY